MAFTKRITPAAKLSTLPETLQFWARVQPEHPAYTFLLDGETREARITYQELEDSVRILATQLTSWGLSGTRALLLYPPGLDYIVGFLACLRAGVTAVPCYPPNPRGVDSRLRAVALDCQAAAALSTRRMLPTLRRSLSRVPELANLPCLVTDGPVHAPAGVALASHCDAASIAFLQYTSGSTSEPRGTIVTHANLMSNQRMIQRAFNQDTPQLIVGWLPLYHDMGLIGNVLHPLYLGASCVLLSHFAFLQSPIRWLNAITRYRGTTSGGPNFAYELCARKITPEQRSSLDLSSWKIAFNGAEPVRPATLELFAETFASCGFRREALRPSYGLAEATLLVSAQSTGQPPRAFDAAALERGQACPIASNAQSRRALASCGQVSGDQVLQIVNPETCLPCAPGQVGEIWLQGPNITSGYWNRPQETARTFGACLANAESEPFLRTGDLGFLFDGELFVTGRLKDLIIVDGRNHYPQDIELTAEGSHSALQPGCCAAFSVEADARERVVLACEVARPHRRRPSSTDAAAIDSSPDPTRIVEAIRRAIGERHGLALHDVILLRPGYLPKTSSGKLQRHLCRYQYLTGTLAVWTKPSRVGREYTIARPVDREHTGSVTPASEVPTREAVQVWLAAWFESELGVRASQTKLDEPFTSYGLSSRDALLLCGDLQRWLGRRLSPALFYEHPTIGMLAQHLSEWPSHSSELGTSQVGTTEEAVEVLLGRLSDRDVDWLLKDPAVTSFTQENEEK